MDVIGITIAATFIVTLGAVAFLSYGAGTDEGGTIKRVKKAYREGRDGQPEVAKRVEPEEAWYTKPRVWVTRVWWIAVIVLLAMSAFGGGGSRGTDSATTPSTATIGAGGPGEPAPNRTGHLVTPAVPNRPRTAGAWVRPDPVFAPVKGSDLTFIVTAATATKRLKSPLGDKTGNWILVTVTVKNASKDAVTIDSSFFILLAADGSTYETDSDNLMYLPADKNFLPAKISPSRSKSGQVLFAVAAGAKPQDFKLVRTGVFSTETGETAPK